MIQCTRDFLLATRWVALLLASIMPAAVMSAAIMSAAIMSAASNGSEPAWRVGVAKVDITPDTPVWLSGYAARSGPFSGIEDRLFVRALVLAPELNQRSNDPNASQQSSSQEKPLVLVSIDSIGISAVMTEAILSQVSPALGIPRSRIVLCTTHSHTAPHLDGVIPNLFANPMAEEQKRETLRYTRTLEDRIVKAIRDAASNLKNGSVHYGLGRSEFAINRRMVKNQQWIGFGTVDDGPVDRTVRVLKVSDDQGATVAVAYQYACHCTSISPELNQVSGDWAGLSAAKLEAAMPGCIALPIIGCGADANPNPRGTQENAQSHGDEMAASVQTVLAGSLKPLPHPSQTAFTLVALASERPSKSRLEEMQNSASAHERNFANSWLELLTRKDRIPESYPAPIHLWTFGTDLAWVFMSGEVVVDYQIRFERELSQFANVWVAGYVDDVFAYVASERVRGEGGYEVDGSMLYYGQPGRWVSGTEETIVDRVLQLSRQKHAAEEPMTPEESLATMEVPDGWTIELVASEPLTTDPVNIAFGADGKVWVVEMGDYPLGGGKTGCIKTLTDTDGDGVMDKSTMFLDGLNYPAGIYAWRDGVVVACAPEIFFARDRDGDGECDERIPFLNGFPEGNPQHRVHGFTYGLDHRLYFGPGGSAENITETGRGLLTQSSPREYRVAGSDISLDPDAGTMRLETGVTQYIRATDDWGQWFGNENSLPMFHYVFDHPWMERAGVFPSRRYQLMTDPPSIPPVFPISQQADRFNDLYAINRFTSACSTIINRGLGQGDAMRGSALVCEPVHNLVTRFQVVPKGATWSAVRTAEDAKSEFVRSSDPWFRPVRIENAPDGTLWIVDMYRYVIEHPEWIPDEWQRRINVRAGDDRGRIYRVRRNDFVPLPIRDSNTMGDAEIVAELASPNSARADHAQQLLIDRRRARGLRPEDLAALRSLANASEHAHARMRAFAALIASGYAQNEDFLERLRDPEPRIVERVVRWIDRAPDPSAIRSQVWQTVRPEQVAKSASLALALAIEGSVADSPNCERITDALAQHADDPWVVEGASLLMPASVDGVVESLLAWKPDTAANVSGAVNRLIEKLVVIASREYRERLLSRISQSTGRRPAWHFVLARPFMSSDQQGIDPEIVERVLADARTTILQANEPIVAHLAALNLLQTQMGERWGGDHDLLLDALREKRSQEFDRNVARTITRLGLESAGKLTQHWHDLSQDARNSILNEWTSKPEWSPQLIDSLRNQKIPVSDIDAVSMQRLRQLPEGVDSKSVLELFGPPPGADREAIVRDALSKWPRQSDLVLGKAAYEKHCAVCHEVRALAGQMEPSIGPNLKGLIHWTNDAWMTAILDPHRSVEEKYWAFQARTEDGELITGLKLREDDSTIEWINSSGRVDRVPKSQLAEVRPSRMSLMPEGFEQLVAPEVLAGIISYLRAESQ